MSLEFYVFWYLVGVVTTMIVNSIRTPETDNLSTTVANLLWFITLPCFAVFWFLEIFGWYVDLDYSKKFVGARMMGSSKYRGVGVSIFWIEIRIFSVRKH